MKANIGRAIDPLRKNALPFKIKAVDEPHKKVKFTFLDRDGVTEKIALPLHFAMFERALTHLEANKAEW